MYSVQNSVAVTTRVTGTALPIGLGGHERVDRAANMPVFSRVFRFMFCAPCDPSASSSFSLEQWLMWSLPFTIGQRQQCKLRIQCLFHLFFLNRSYS
jgi:hypothetical protein